MMPGADILQNDLDTYAIHGSNSVGSIPSIIASIFGFTFSVSLFLPSFLFFSDSQRLPIIFILKLIKKGDIYIYY